MKNKMKGNLDNEALEHRENVIIQHVNTGRGGVRIGCLGTVSGIWMFSSAAL